MSERQRRLAITLSDDKSSATIEFLPDSGVTGSMTLSLEQMTALINGLGDVRAGMVAGKPFAPFGNQAINAVFNTQWFVQPEPLSGGSILFFDHPNYGKIGFGVPREQVAEMVRLLTIQLGLPPSTSETPN